VSIVGNLPREIVYSPEMKAFWEALWSDVSPDLRAQYADAIRGGNLIALMAVPFVVIRALTLLGVDSELLGIISFLHKWATVIVFASFLWGVVFRALVGAFTRKKSNE
jgi:hypothetical protein